MPTVAEIIAQSTGLPHENNSVVDHPTAALYDWGTHGWDPDLKPNANTPPAGRNEITGYVYSYNIAGAPYVRQKMYARNMQTWVRANGVWSKVEDMYAPGFAPGGAYFVGDMTGNTGEQMNFTWDNDVVSFDSPAQTTNCHFYMVPRGPLPAGVDATLVAIELKCDAGTNVIAGVGSDWWTGGQGWPEGITASMQSSMRILGPNWRWVCVTNLNEQELIASHPPIVTIENPPETVGYSATMSPIADCLPGDTIRLEASIAANNATSSLTRHVFLHVYRVSTNTRVIEKTFLTRPLSQTPTLFGANTTLPATFPPGQYRVQASVQTGSFSWLPVTQTPIFFNVLDPNEEEEPQMVLNISGNLTKEANGTWTNNLMVTEQA